MSRHHDGCTGGGPFEPADAHVMPEGIAEPAKSVGLQANILNSQAPKNARVVDGNVVYKGKVKVGRKPAVALCEETSFFPPVLEDPSIFVEQLAGDYDGVFPEVTEHEVTTRVKVDGHVDRNRGKATAIKARYVATGRIIAESPPDCSSVSKIAMDGSDLCAPYEQRLVNFIMVISTLSGNCASYVVEDVRRLLYLRDGKISRSSLVTARKEACKSLARLASLRKALAVVDEHDKGFTTSSADALLELDASLGGALAYRSSDGKHPVLYLQIASLFPTHLYLQVTPAQFQKLLLRVFGRLWSKLSAASRRHGEKISHVAVVLDFNSLSQLEVAAYPTHRLLGDIGEVLRAYCPWLIYKIVVYKFQFAKDLLWELMRPVLELDCRIVMAESDEELVSEIQAEGHFLLHTLGGFNESIFLRCRRPAYRLAQPPQPLGSGEWLSSEDTPFWDEMRKLYEEAPWALPEADPVDDVISEPEDPTARARAHIEDKRERAMEDKAKELEELINRKECLVPHFSKAVEQLLSPQECAIPERSDLLKESSRPLVALRNVTRSDVRVCMWKPPADATIAAQGTVQMLLKLFEKRRQWTRPPLPANYMHAFERTTYSLDCVYVSGRLRKLGLVGHAAHSSVKTVKMACFFGEEPRMEIVMLPTCDVLNAACDTSDRGQVYKCSSHPSAH
ncbi:hypothetical protein Emag_004649 [Eimeria magna]